MTYEGDAASRRSHWSGGTSISNDNLVSSSRLLLLQRRLKRAKRNTAANTQQQQQQPTVPRQKKKLDGFLEKTQSKLTISTAETSCTSSLSQSLPANHSFEYQISKMPSQQSFGNDTHGSGSGSMEDSLTDSFATFTISSQARDAAALFKEWRSIYAVSAENSEHYADDEDGDDDTTQYDDNTQNDYTTKKEEFHSDETFISHVDEESHAESYAESQAFGQMIIDGTPSDLLSGQYTVESSTDEMNPPNQHIPTPPETTRTSCSINFDFFGGNDLLKSVVEKVSRMASTGKNEDGVNDDNSECSDDDSSCSEKSDSSGETNNLIPNELVHFDGGVTQATTNWTFDSSLGGTVDSEE